MNNDQKLQTCRRALLPYDINGFVYLSRKESAGPQLLRSDNSDYSLLLAEKGMLEEASENLLDMHFEENSCNINLSRIQIESGVPDDIIRLSLQDAVSMVGDGRIRDLFTSCALLHADRFKRIEIQTGILFQDEHCVAVNKPAGLLVHRTELSRDTDYLLQRVRNQTGQKVFPVHRLDRPTSGVTLFVFSKDLASEFSREFRERNVKKTYLAVVRGWTEDTGVIDSPLKTKNGTFQDALTLYKTLGRTELPIPVRPYETARYSLVEVDLKTGRNHQIRRHFAHLSHPLIGDTNHGDGAHNRMFKDKFNCSRLLLAATCLQLQHPITRKQLDIKAPLDPEFKILLQKTGLASNSKCGNDADCNCESDLHK